MIHSFMLWASMGGYSSYIWPAYAIVSVFLLANLFACRWQKRRLKKQLRSWFNHCDESR